METIQNIVIPRAYRKVDSVDKVSSDAIRYFVGENRESYGPYLFDPSDKEYKKLRGSTIRASRKIQHSTQLLLDLCESPFRSKSMPDIDRSIAEQRRHISILVRPPFFRSDADNKGETRFQQQPGSTALFIHVDEAGTVHRTRWYRHRYPDAYAAPLDVFANLASSEMQARGVDFSAAYKTEDWNGCSEIIFETIDNAYGDIAFSENIPRNWVLPELDGIHRDSPEPVLARAQLAE